MYSQTQSIFTPPSEKFSSIHLPRLLNINTLVFCVFMGIYARLVKIHLLHLETFVIHVWTLISGLCHQHIEGNLDFLAK